MALSDKVIGRIAAECDIVIQSQFGILTGDMLNLTEHGVLTVH